MRRPDRSAESTSFSDGNLLIEKILEDRVTQRAGHLFRQFDGRPPNTVRRSVGRQMNRRSAAWEMSRLHTFDPEADTGNDNFDIDQGIHSLRLHGLAVCYRKRDSLIFLAGGAHCSESQLDCSDLSKLDSFRSPGIYNSGFACGIFCSNDLSVVYVIAMVRRRIGNCYVGALGKHFRERNRRPNFWHRT